MLPPITRRTFLRGAAVTVAAAAAGVPLIRREIETHQLQQRAVRLAIGLQRPLRVAALGDLHFDPLFEDAYLEHVAQSLTGLKADLIVYTGDFVTLETRRVQDLAVILSRAQSRLGSYATLGNHDHWVDAPAVTAALEKNGIRVLCNASISLPDEDQVYLSALDSFCAGAPDPRILAKTPASSRHILLVHEPDSFVQLDDPRIKLQISGHTHGGQIRVPVVGALFLPSWGRLFQQGLFARDGRHLYVNRGVGTLRPHVRFRCPPEITVFELT